ncbi:hypothetical protein BDF21DRAFT_397705 [Thamnidium elegans]|nr:hypothetical protein BDF21DRAFT_397705 [Thamnidium elegans]
MVYCSIRYTIIYRETKKTTDNEKVLAKTLAMTTEGDVEIGGNILNNDPLVLEEATTYMSAEEIVQEEDVVENKSTDATRRRIGQIKGFLKSMILNAENREQISITTFSTPHQS